MLFGLDQLRAAGFTVEHNLDRAGPPPRRAQATGALVKRALEAAGGYGGDFTTVLASLGRANRADVVVSTVDTVGIPAILLARCRVLRRPLVYVAVGLPERLERLRGTRMRRLYASALAACSEIVTYSEHEADALRRWLADHGRPRDVVFLPFGVDTDALVPSSRPAENDVVSVGADPHRDFGLLLRIAHRLPATSFRLVLGEDHAHTASGAPDNVAIEIGVPFETMLGRLSAARVVALPVRENSYSGATTVLLQAMALGKPVVVTRTQAIATGYGLVDGENCRLVAPGDDDAFESAVRDVLEDEAGARALGAGARATVVEDLGWTRYVERLREIVAVAGAR